MSFKPTVLTVEPDRKLHWLSKLLFPGIFDGAHHLEIAPMARGSSSKQEEKFSGTVVAMMGATTFDQTQRGFVAMNEALKRRAEA